MRWKVFKRKSTCNKEWWSDNLSPIFPLFPSKIYANNNNFKTLLNSSISKRKIELGIEYRHIPGISSKERQKQGRNRHQRGCHYRHSVAAKKIMERIYIYAMYVYIYIYISNNETGILGYSNFLVAWRAQLCKILNILACKYWKFWTGHTVWTQGFGNVVYRADVHW